MVKILGGNQYLYTCDSFNKAKNRTQKLNITSINHSGPSDS